MSWHINNKGKSIIQEMINEFHGKENAYIHIFTPDDDFYIWHDDDCIVAKGFIYTQRSREDKTTIEIINIDKIESIYIADKHVTDTERASDDNS